MDIHRYNMHWRGILEFTKPQVKKIGFNFFLGGDQFNTDPTVAGVLWRWNWWWCQLKGGAEWFDVIWPRHTAPRLSSPRWSTSPSSSATWGSSSLLTSPSSLSTSPPDQDDCYRKWALSWPILSVLSWSSSMSSWRSLWLSQWRESWSWQPCTPYHQCHLAKPQCVKPLLAIPLIITTTYNCDRLYLCQSRIHTMDR